MRTVELRALLDRLDDTGEIVVLRQRTDGALHDAYLDAREAAQDAYRWWQRDGGADAYVAYVAAQDRADAAQDMLALEPA
jgi:hypothetical protein